MSSAEPVEISIRDESIRLGQLLKLAGIAEDGAQARELLADDAVQVDGVAENRRGAQVHRGALVAVDLPSGPVAIRVS
ncbi:RNA-binding S4 domain protein [Beutenbergia cavernae DSM 12333]|uniref:RNA-binding S4 domain protein n=1 Tax=Beutenbergia cavernae (strain ATCC BAA-8 / DSM 12333 / CCUG 43141 / JCM 11478 / NBRC 16432 / NCIMB 13614 / HKI 0122) TaxID=471853 RepID=C5BW46_BEUC1|nr:RNA-binding S4 domain-containing protein [Beutenbergia cavernae]ACQ80647.1 RNA-binding S4 domain protein [Beutenbergia cavernae DSM 12333]